MRQRVLVDANVLYSRTLRDWILMLAYCGSPERFYDVLWTEDILAETIASFREKHPQCDGGYIAAIAEKLRAEFADCQVRDYNATKYFGDPKDAHVHGAAIAGEADYLVTLNLRDFDVVDKDQLPYEIYTPDAFLMLIWESQPEIVRNVFLKMEKYRAEKKRTYSLAQLLKDAGATDFAGIVAQLNCDRMNAC